MPDFFIRIFERIAITVLSLAIIWLIVTRIYEPLDQQLPAFVAFVITYIIAAYILLPRVISFLLKILRNHHIPRFTRTNYGLPLNPVNIILVGSKDDLQNAFSSAGWYKADSLTIKSGWDMVIQFIRNKPYPCAPFSSQYLFGRRQDFGFQEPIGSSPRKRHHIRFWAANFDFDDDLDASDAQFWAKEHSVNPDKSTIWVGSATKDIGIGFTRFTYQISHAVDPYVDQEREYIIACLRKNGWLKNEDYLHSGEFVVGNLVSDGRIVAAKLASTEN